jgi:glycosyltransferase involved in cell wall biosynthesis
MKVLLCHAYYTQRGGEDQSFEEERSLLLAGGHEVFEYIRDNDELKRMNALTTAANTLWNRSAARDVGRMVEQHRPDVVHITNTFPLISPAVCIAARKRGAAVVQALRNYRLICSGAYLMRDGRPCEECLGRLVPWPAIINRCYRDSTAATAAVAAMQLVHRAAGTWRRSIDAFFTLTEFARQRFIEAGFPAGKLHVKNNCVHPDPEAGSGSGKYVVFAGRLSPEKGVATLLDAWQRDATLPPLQIIGDGPLAPAVQAAVRSDSRITWRGRLESSGVHASLQDAGILVMPSVWYETFGRTIAEAYACGTPVAASDLGAMAELVAEGVTGTLFRPGDAASLALAIHRLTDLSPMDIASMRVRARNEFEVRYSPGRCYRRLIEIYESALRQRWSSEAVHKSRRDTLVSA